MTAAGVGAGVATDVFEVAAWLEELGGRPAKAVSADMVEWMCSTWGSGKGGGDRLDTALFILVATLYDLDTWCNKAGRHELVVSVPVRRFAAIETLIDLIGVDAESWPWLLLDDDDTNDEGGDGEDARLVLAALILGTSVAYLSSDNRLLKALGLA